MKNMDVKVVGAGRFARTLPRIALGALLAIAISDKSFAEECKTHSELINMPVEILGDVTPCDFIGAAYMIGLGAGVGGYHGSLSSGDYMYYPLLRYYFDTTGRIGETDSRDAEAYLFVAAQILADTEFLERDKRYYSYQAFVLGSFWKMNEDSVDGSNKIIRDYFVLLLSQSESENFEGLRCFIKADIPTLPIELIKSSQRYISCLGEEK